MKYIKKYEENLYLFSDLEVGDYVLIDTSPDIRYRKEEYQKILPYGKVIQKAARTENPYKYKLSVFKQDEIKMTDIWIKQNNIIRKLSKNEIDDFNSKENMVLFNL